MMSVCVAYNGTIRSAGGVRETRARSVTSADRVQRN